MSGPSNRPTNELTCVECREWLAGYLDEGLGKAESMQVFLHVRACADCAAALARQQRLIDQLQALPRRQPPAHFDAKIMASVPLASYRAMAELRRPRVAVLLDAETLPAWVRSAAVRGTGVAVAALAVAGQLAGVLPAGVVTVAAVGLLPEAVVRLQALGRRLVPGVHEVRRGA